MKKVVAMYEQEEAYGKNLAEYINRRESVPFEMQVFSQADKLSAYLQGHTPQLLLLSEGSSLESYGEIREKADEVVYLTGQKEQVQGQNGDYIYKYQPTDQILNQLIQHIGSKEQRDNAILQTSCPIYGVYSPVGRCGKTTFSLLLGELLSRRRSVLYIGFDELSFLEEDKIILEERNTKNSNTEDLNIKDLDAKDFNTKYLNKTEKQNIGNQDIEEWEEERKKGKTQLTEEKTRERKKEEEHREMGTLSDAYFYCQKHGLREKLPTIVSHWHGIDVLTGMNCPEDLCAIQAKEWSMLVQKIAREAGYASIVLDMGTRLWLADELFSLCFHIYVPVLSERYAREQYRRFEKWLEQNGEEETLGRMQTVELPHCAQNGTMKERLEYALWGETGDYVRSLMPGEW